MKKQLFFENSYFTDVSKNPKGICAWMKRSRLNFILRFARIVFRSRRLALDGKYDVNEWCRSSIETMRALEVGGAIIDIKGFDNFKDLNEPVVFVSNHMSTLETLVFPSLIAPFLDVTFVVKDSLVKIPVFGSIMRARDPIVVSRNNSRNDLLEVLSRGSEFLEKGTSIIIFPQSTRRPYLKISEFNSLAVKLASKNGVRLVPIALKTDYWKKGKLISEFGPFDREQNKVYIEFGQPLTVEGNGKETHKIIIDFISGKLRSWNAKVFD